MVKPDQELVKKMLYTEPAKLLYGNVRHKNYNPHVSGNAFNTTKLEYSDNIASVNVHAPIYDKDIWEKDKVIVHTGQGSYAEALDIEGGYSGDHKGYILDCVNLAMFEIIERAISLGLKVKEIEIK